MNTNFFFTPINVTFNSIIIGLAIFSLTGCVGPRYLQERSETERSLHYAVDAIGEYIGKYYDMKCISAKVASNKRSEVYGLSFYAKTQMTLDQARLVGPCFYTRFLSVLNHYEPINRFVLAMSKEEPTISWEPSENTITFKITYWNENMSYQLSPYIAAITFSEETFNYYEADPKTQKLRLVLSEPYKETIDRLLKIAEIAVAKDPEKRKDLGSGLSLIFLDKSDIASQN